MQSSADCSRAELLHGIWINGSSNNRVVNSTGRNNSQVGLYIGCAQTGGVGGTCQGGATGSANVVKFGQWEFNPVAGLGVDAGDLANQIGLNEIVSNGAAEAVDANASGTDLWFFDDFSKTWRTPVSNEKRTSRPFLVAVIKDGASPPTAPRLAYRGESKRKSRFSLRRCA